MIKQQDYDESNGTPGGPPMTTVEVAHALASSIDVARRLMRTKKILAFKAGGQWRAYPQHVAIYICEQLEIRE